MKLLNQLILDSDVFGSKPEGNVTIASLTDRTDAVVAGSLFFAIKGTKNDGHDFIDSALSKSASAIVVEDPSAFHRHPKTILVRSTRKAMAVAASRWFDAPTQRLALVGVTGTNGKTTSTYLLKHIWENLGLTTGVVGTVEYHIGSQREPARLTTPSALELQALFLRMVENGVSHAAVEVSSIALDQNRTTGCHFKVGLFTNLTQDHLDYHGDWETYYLAKQKLFREYGLEIAILNSDDPWGRRLYQETTAKKRICLSLNRGGGDFWIKEAQFGKDATAAIIVTPEGEYALRSPLIGRHNLYNCLGVLAATWALEQDLSAALDALSRSSGAPGRLERVFCESGRPHIFVDYAHSDDALKNVLQSLHDLRAGHGRIITVFGCGGDRDKSKRPKMAEVASHFSDITIATSDNPRTENPDTIIDELENGILREKTRYYREVNRKKAIQLALSLAEPSDLVLVAGKGHETYQILGTEHIPFDDREVIRDYYQNNF